MKHINLVTTLSPQKQYQIKRWFYLSLLLYALTIIGVSLVLLPELYTLYKLKTALTLLTTQTTNHTPLIQTRDMLKQQHEAVEKQIARLNRYREHHKNLYEYIIIITRALAENGYLKHLQLQKKEIIINIQCSNPEKALIFIQKLHDSQKFTQLVLHSFEQDMQTKLFTCVIKGKINK